MTDDSANPAASDGRMPAIYLGHGAPPLLEDAVWMKELGGWARDLPRPSAILIVSAHWQTAPMALSATTPVPLVYDFYGFPEQYYRLRYDAPAAPDLAARVRALMPATEPVLERPNRGLDHGAWVPLKAMYPAADIPVLQLSMPDLDPQHLFDVGRRLAPLRDEGVLIIGSGLTYHNMRGFGQPQSTPVAEVFEEYLNQAISAPDEATRDDMLVNWAKAPAARAAHPREDHLIPLMVVAGAAGADSGRRIFVDHVMAVNMASYVFGGAAAPS